MTLDAREAGRISENTKSYMESERSKNKEDFRKIREREIKMVEEKMAPIFLERALEAIRIVAETSEERRTHIRIVRHINTLDDILAYEVKKLLEEKGVSVGVVYSDEIPSSNFIVNYRDYYLVIDVTW